MKGERKFQYHGSTDKNYSLPDYFSVLSVHTESHGVPLLEPQQMCPKQGKGIILC